MVKRPQGLKKAAQSKKQKVVASEPPTSKASGSSSTAESNVPELTIEVDQDFDPEDDLGQLTAMYKTFLDTKKSLGDLGDIQSDEDMQQVDLCKKLVTGIIHECDHLLRSAHEQKDQEKQQQTELTAEFYNIYALSLLAMASFGDSSEESKETPQDFISAAIERAETALEHVQKNSGILHFTLAKAKLHLADEQLNREDDFSQFVDSLKDVVRHYESGEKLSPHYAYSQDNLETLEHLLQTADVIGSSDTLNDSTDGASLQEVRLTYLDWIKTRWQDLLKGVDTQADDLKLLDNIEDTRSRANRGLGEYYLALAAPLLAKYEGDNIDDDDESDDSDESDESEEPPSLSESELSEVRASMQNAVKYLLAAKDKQDARTYVVAAEAQISLANLYETDGKEQKDLYLEAVGNLKRAQRLGYGNYQQLISELLDE